MKYTLSLAFLAVSLINNQAYSMDKEGENEKRLSCCGVMCSNLLKPLNIVMDSSQRVWLVEQADKYLLNHIDQLTADYILEPILTLTMTTKNSEEKIEDKKKQ
jgi:hypothetical protein